MDEEDERVEVVVPDEQLSLAIGRRGQNVRLASQLTGWQIDIMTESQESERRQREFAERTVLFQEALDVDEVIAQLLVTEGFVTVEDVAYVELGEVAAIEGFDEDTAKKSRPAPAIFWSARRPNSTPNAGPWASRTACSRWRASPCRWRSPWARETSRRSRIWPVSSGRYSWLVRSQGWRASARTWGSRELQPQPGRRRSLDHARAHRRGMDRRRSLHGGADRRGYRRCGRSHGRSAGRFWRTRALNSSLPPPSTLALKARERRDLVTGEVMAEARLVRFVAAPGGGSFRMSAGNCLAGAYGWRRIERPWTAR